MDRERQGEPWEAARKTDSKEATSCLPADATDRARNSLTGVSQHGTWSPEADPSMQLEVSHVHLPLRMKLLVNANHRGLGFLEPDQPVVERSGKGGELRSLGFHCIIVLLKSSKE